MGKIKERSDGAPAGRPRSRQTTQVATDLSRLLRARAFCLEGALAPPLQRLSANLQALGGSVEADAAAWIGVSTPPPDRPTISLGDEPGTLGPRSFGFLNNVDGVAPLAAPIPERPRRGGVALVVPRRDALPELVPLLLRRRLGLSWLISVGDGDPAEVLRFLGADPATTGILLALGRGVRAATLHGALGGKQTVLLDLAGWPSGPGAGREGVLCRAVARRAGVPAVGELESWLAHGALYDAAARPGESRGRPRASVVVVGAGADFVAAEAQRARLPAPVTVESDDPGLGATLAQAAMQADLVLLCGDPEETAAIHVPRPTLRVDPSQPERLRAMLQAVAQRAPAPADSKPASVKPDAARLQALMTDLPPPLYVGGRMVAEESLSDHDAKRLLRAYGARVSRQAPANTVTAVQRIAGQIGLPVVLVPAQAEAGQGAAAQSVDEEVPCHTGTELKRQATLLLQKAPHLMVREHFPEAPRARLSVTQERGLGPVLRLGGEAALLPLPRGEARELAEALAAEHDVDPKGLTELLSQVAACARDHDVTLDLQLFLGDEPVVVSARGSLRRPESAGT